MSTPDPLIYKTIANHPKITLGAWVELAPLFLPTLRTEKTDLAELKAKWQANDIRDTMPYRIVRSLKDEEPLFIIPPRAWSESTDINVSSAVLLANKVGRNTNPKVRSKFLRESLGRIEFSGKLPDVLLKEWEEIERLTRQHLKLDTTQTTTTATAAKEYSDEGEDDWG